MVRRPRPSNKGRQLHFQLVDIPGHVVGTDFIYHGKFLPHPIVLLGFSVTRHLAHLQDFDFSDNRIEIRSEANNLRVVLEIGKQCMRGGGY